MWQESYRIGVDIIDEQHMGLFEMVENFLTVLHQEDTEEKKRKCVVAIGFMKEYVTKHFLAEEEYQIQIQYAGLKEHKQLHDDFTKRVLDYERKIEESNFDLDVIKGFAGMLVTWLIYHVADADQKIVKEPEKKIPGKPLSFLECFTQSIKEVIDKLVGIQVEEIAHNVDLTEAMQECLYVETEITGDMNVKIALVYSDDLSFDLLNKMTRMVSQAHGEIIRSMLIEVTNIICGKALSNLAENQINCIAKVPKLSFDKPYQHTYDSVKYSTGCGNLEFQFAALV